MRMSEPKPMQEGKVSKPETIATIQKTDRKDYFTLTWKPAGGKQHGAEWGYLETNKRSSTVILPLEFPRHFFLLPLRTLFRACPQLKVKSQVGFHFPPFLQLKQHTRPHVHVEIAALVIQLGKWKLHIEQRIHPLNYHSQHAPQDGPSWCLQEKPAKRFLGGVVRKCLRSWSPKTNGRATAGSIRLFFCFSLVQ